ncbi:dimethylsulfonioproprionate lyase family protein [Aminobacter aganoensis]|uniref:Mannose-6-phosphate isomerase-like protein (Cupin superfamily) n=1 Tax=Aminobacter aganoensis TaxID=83264 RepID=A0A7X0F446_9HYPH|nr:mannose-6-phosphate isomerase-like protein (cupin superfamily) [Aminobacter aganoensis]
MTTNFNELLATFRDYLQGSSADPVVASFLADIGWSMPPRALEPKKIPGSSLLDRAVQLASDATRPLASALSECRDELRWGQTYTTEDFGQHFIDNYGWVELFGTRGHFVNEQLAAGFLALGPGIEYPDHHHIAEELYIPLTGSAEWRMGDEPFRLRAAGEVIHHASNVNHAMRTGLEPMLALYLWRGGPLAQRSTIARA